MTTYIFAFLTAFLLSFALTPIMGRIAVKFNFLDIPDDRKIHKGPIPRIGGFAVFIAFLATALFFVNIDRGLFGVLLAASFLVVVGIFDDKYSLPPLVKLLGHLVAAILLISFGVKLGIVTNPFGGVVDLADYKILLHLGSSSFFIPVISDVLTVFWVVLLINALNFLDGLDGLAAGVSGIGALTLFFLSASAFINQPVTAFLCIILAGASFGFLPFNFHKAKVFLGDSGSMFLGFMLAVFAIISGAKLATAALALGFPILDLGWTVLRRIFSGKNPFKADRSHLHHKLLDLGLTQRKIVLGFYLISAIFGGIAIFGRTREKLIGLSALLFVMVAAVFIIYQILKPAKSRD